MHNNNSELPHDAVASLFAKKPANTITREGWCRVDWLHKTAKRLAEEAGLTYTEEHAEILEEIFIHRTNVFLTGGAGTGKSSLLKNEIIPILNELGRNFAITATTGVAASLIGGKTLHSWAGVGLGPAWGFQKDAHDYDESGRADIYETTFKNWQTKAGKYIGITTRKFGNTDILVIDEGSMLSGESFLNYVDFFIRKLTGVDHPFGGIQVLVIGDFMQLPPVGKNERGIIDWAFNSKAWKDADIKPMSLTKVFRQADGIFVDLLNRLRLGDAPTANQWEALRKQVVPDPTLISDATFLTPVNRTADAINRQWLNSIPTQLVEIPAMYDILDHQLPGTMSAEVVRKQLDKTTNMKQTLALKEGCRVMMLKNAISYHNGSQGTLEEVVMEVSKTTGRPYVKALKIRLDELDETPPGIDAEDDPDVNLVTILRASSTRGNHEPEEAIHHIEDKVTGELKEVPKFPRLRQFPVVQCNSITIHKAQGASLDRAEIDLETAFAPHSAYVALSRLRKLEGLLLRKLELPILVDPEALAFTKSIPPILPADHGC